MKCPKCDESVIFEETKLYEVVSCPKCHVKLNEKKIRRYNYGQ